MPPNCNYKVFSGYLIKNVTFNICRRIYLYRIEEIISLVVTVTNRSESSFLSRAQDNYI